MVELLVGIMVGGMLIATAGSLWFYSNRTFAAQLNYVDMDQASQMALDRLSREIRQTRELVSESKRKLIFIDHDGEELTYQHSNTDNLLQRVKGGVTNVLLANCTDVDFTIFQRNPVAGSYDQYPAATADNCKLVHVRWTCSRPLFGTGQDNTESVSSAKIVIRNP
jgi:hypothetical protein